MALINKFQIYKLNIFKVTESIFNALVYYLQCNKLEMYIFKIIIKLFKLCLVVIRLTNF